jgi:hypothetical protein
MAKRKVISRKKVKHPERDEEVEMDVEEEVDDFEPPHVPAPPARKSVAEQAEEMRRASETCPECIHMAPRQCRAHRINLPI